MDQQNDNNALRQRKQELERQIEEKDQLLRQQESESRQQLDGETALRIQKEGELSAHIKTKEQQVWKTWELHENEKTEIRKAHAREIALHQDKDEALFQVQQLWIQQLQAQQLQTKKELEHCQERGARAEKERDEMFKDVGEMKLTIYEAEKEIAALEKKKDEALMQRDSFEKEKDEALSKLQSSSMLDFFDQCQTSLSSKLTIAPARHHCLERFLEPQQHQHRLRNQDPVPDSADPKEKAKKDKFFKAQAGWILVALLKATDTFGEAKPGQPPRPGMNLFYGALMQIYD
ncbi:hypothetical protein E4U49_006220 [Claviceps purpurea]|nr:hypothetical protein E4U49_006220 [Claviceps purpurea]